jgi:hypothetical protein
MSSVYGIDFSFNQDIMVPFSAFDVGAGSI